MTELGEKILNYRAKHDLSQAKFASKCRVTAQTIYNIERGVQSPRSMTLKKIMNVINEDKN